MKRHHKTNPKPEALPTGDICDALEQRGDKLSLWAARVIHNLRHDAHQARIALVRKSLSDGGRG